jgi:hypothetical protein
VGRLNLWNPWKVHKEKISLYGISDGRDEPKDEKINERIKEAGRFGIDQP